ncbi:TetR/AcrR family transcriptional regulator [Nonomuraea sp. NPDC050404]|uniref:TetR/AcrR family transcriptional regulator n=1 Tax=Nonomuraea sp. NPDC050404 TaxID=3155783 RepID=UPI0033E83A0D
MDGTRTLGRRERLRIETTAEIKAVAMDLMAEGGPGAISLRAIARQMGMTPNAIYAYFATRDDLVTTLISDVYTGLADATDAALDAAPPGDAAALIRAWGGAFRTWALAHPQGFRLIYSEAVPGYLSPEGGAGAEAEARFCLGLTRIAVTAWPHARHLHPDDFTWDDFETELLAPIREIFPGLTPTALALTLRIWGHLHGIVSLEVYGHLRAPAATLDKIYNAELAQLIRSLGIDP